MVNGAGDRMFPSRVRCMCGGGVRPFGSWSLRHTPTADLRRALRAMALTQLAAAVMLAAGVVAAAAPGHRLDGGDRAPARRGRRGRAVSAPVLRRNRKAPPPTALAAARVCTQACH